MKYKKQRSYYKRVRRQAKSCTIKRGKYGLVFMPKRLIGKKVKIDLYLEVK